MGHASTAASSGLAGRLRCPAAPLLTSQPQPCTLSERDRCPGPAWPSPAAGAAHPQRVVARRLVPAPHVVGQLQPGLQAVAHLLVVAQRQRQVLRQTRASAGGETAGGRTCRVWPTQSAGGLCGWRHTSPCPGPAAGAAPTCSSGATKAEAPRPAWPAPRSAAARTTPAGRSSGEAGQGVYHSRRSLVLHCEHASACLLLTRNNSTSKDGRRPPSSARPRSGTAPPHPCQTCRPRPPASAAPTLQRQVEVQRVARGAQHRDQLRARLHRGLRGGGGGGSDGGWADRRVGARRAAATPARARSSACPAPPGPSRRPEPGCVLAAAPPGAPP